MASPLGALRDAQFWRDIAENIGSAGRGLTRGLTADIAGTPVDLITAPLPSRRSANPYANAIRDLIGGTEEMPRGGSEWLASKLGMEDEDSPAYMAGRLLGPLVTPAAPRAAARIGEELLVPTSRAQAQMGAIGDLSAIKDVPKIAEDGLSKWAQNASMVPSDAAKSFDFKSGQPVLLEAFHGTKRPDRIGDVFKKSRATSGPMAFHTSSPELASNYAQSKRDTSLYNEDTDYKNWFKAKVQGARNPIDIVRSWWHLSPEEKKTISELAPRITNDEEGNLILGPEGYNRGIGNFDLNLKESRGNPLGALVDEWLNSGHLYGQEEEFSKVLKSAGYPMNRVIYDSPELEYPFVFKNYIKMNRPLVTNDVPEEVVDALNEAAKKDRSRVKYRTGADPWDKSTRTLREWVNAFNGPDNKYVWTSIPDKVTDVFRKMGYDGIIDWSGKSGGTMSPVYIPFEENQVKSALGNVGKYDPTKKSILKAEGGYIQTPDYNDAEVTRIADEIQRRYAQGGAVHYDEDLVNRIADEVMEQLYG